MKSLTLIILSVSVIFGLICCRKDDTVNDYRSAFTGTYSVKKTTTCYGLMDDCYYEKDTTIYVTPGDGDSTIVVLGRNIAINPDGVFFGYRYSLQFRNDSIFSFQMTGGLGAGTYIRHEGKRVSKKIN